MTAVGTAIGNVMYFYCATRARGATRRTPRSTGGPAAAPFCGTPQCPLLGQRAAKAARYAPRTCLAASMLAGESVLGVSELSRLITESSCRSVLGGRRGYAQSTRPCAQGASARWRPRSRTRPCRAHAGGEQRAARWRNVPGWKYTRCRPGRLGSVSGARLSPTTHCSGATWAT